MIYLASPYTSPDPLLRKTRFLLVEQVTAQLIEEGYFIYSPIVHCHAFVEKYALDSTFTYWRQYNIDMIRRADELWVLTIPGYLESRGVTAEIDFARLAGLEIKWVNEEGKLWLP